MAHIFGSHTIDNGGIDQAIRRSAAAGLRAVQIFSAIPKYYGEKVGVRPEKAQRFRAALAETGIAPTSVLVHAAYVLNTASSEPEKAERAASGLSKELERTTALGAFACCFHPGSAGDAPLDDAVQQVAEAMTRAIRANPGGARVLIENTAGAGKTVGRTPDEVGAILSGIPAELRARAGYGLDTCHLFAAGYDISASPDEQRRIIDAFVKATGEHPAFFHLNDSQGALGSNRDRHMLLGEGQIGVEPFRWLLRDPRAVGIPLILETPQENPTIADEDTSADPYDVRMATLLSELARDGDGASNSQ
jgi:deoxyribonuclease-4